MSELICPHYFRGDGCLRSVVPAKAGNTFLQRLPALGVIPTTGFRLNSSAPFIPEGRRSRPIWDRARLRPLTGRSNAWDHAFFADAGLFALHNSLQEARSSR